MKKLILFYLPDCNVSKLFEERLHKALALPEFAGRFNLIRYNLYTDTGRQEARNAGISDAPTAYCNGDILHGVQSDYTIRKYLRKLLGKS
nr:MAG: glutaredoxin-like domain protein [Bacteriophage sp.]